MIWIKIAIGVFIGLESMNVIFLYFFPDQKLANGMGVFKAWEVSKSDPQIHALVRYLTNWVAGSKLIFLLLLLVILFTAGDQSLILTSIALALAISSFYWRLYPEIKAMDDQGQIDPSGYSRTLAVMIGIMILIFSAVALVALI